MADDDKKSGNSDAPATSLSSGNSSSSSPIILILSVVNLLITLGVAVVVFISFQKEKHRPSVEDIVAKGSSEGADKSKGKEGEEKEGEAKGGEGKEGEGKTAEKKKFSDYGKMITLEQFTVNLSTPGSVNPKFVRVNISLEVPTEDIESEVNTKMPQVRNTIIDLFNSKRVTDLAAAEGRDYVKEEIKNALNGFLISGKVKGVYFTNFALAG
jgi:flagellar FliL protein